MQAHFHLWLHIHDTLGNLKLNEFFRGKINSKIYNDFYYYPGLSYTRSPPTFLQGKHVNREHDVLHPRAAEDVFIVGPLTSPGCLRPCPGSTDYTSNYVHLFQH